MKVIEKSIADYIRDLRMKNEECKVKKNNCSTTSQLRTFV